jgi:hypothetical protein
VRRARDILYLSYINVARVGWIDGYTGNFIFFRRGIARRAFSYYPFLYLFYYSFLRLAFSRYFSLYLILFRYLFLYFIRRRRRNVAIA